MFGRRGRDKTPPENVDTGFSWNPFKLVNLQGFSNASFQNYRACIYVRSVSKSEEISIISVAAKSRLIYLFIYFYLFISTLFILGVKIKIYINENYKP